MKRVIIISIFFVICSLSVSCGLGETSDSSNQPSEQKIKNNAEHVDIENITIGIAEGVENTPLRKSTINLLTEFLSDYPHPNRLINLFDDESQRYQNIPFYSYHIPEFLQKNAFKIYKPTLLSIYSVDSDTIAKVSFHSVDSLNNVNLKAIFNFGLTITRSELLLRNMVLINSKNWTHRKIGLIDYIYPSCHNFSEKRALKMFEFTKELSNLFNVDLFGYRYYITANEIELQRLRGIDYLVNMYSMNNSSGGSEVANNIIYAGNNSEYYPHELVHLFVRKWIGSDNYHPWFNEGLATYLGGSVEMSLDWHLQELAEYSKNESIDFSDVLNLQTHISDRTGMRYVFGGLICKLAYEKGGIESVKELFTVGKTDDDFYTAIYNVLGVKREDLNKFIRNELSEYSQ